MLIVNIDLSACTKWDMPSSLIFSPFLTSWIFIILFIYSC